MTVNQRQEHVNNDTVYNSSPGKTKLLLRSTSSWLNSTNITKLIFLHCDIITKKVKIFIDDLDFGRLKHEYYFMSYLYGMVTGKGLILEF